ncbi:MAG: NAD(P)-binding domain-containing protein [Gemmatimonadota bacterium]
MLQERYGQLAGYLAQFDRTLLGLNFADLVQASLAPGDLFRILHHPRQRFEAESQIALEFHQAEPIDYLLITQEEVGGLWNDAPRNLLTLSPGHWMEFAYYPLARHAAETGLGIDANDLIAKPDLIGYYHRVPARFEQGTRIHTYERATRIEPDPRGFRVTTADVSFLRETWARDRSRPPIPQPQDDLSAAPTRQYTCRYLIYAAGQRCILRPLGVPGEDLPVVAARYDRPEDFPGPRVAVIGGGRSADWAATELHDAGRQVYYVMRQPRERHWALIGDSRQGLPYYARLAQLLEERTPRLEPLYRTRVVRIDPAGEGGVLTLEVDGTERQLEVDHVVRETSGWADYSLFSGFPDLQLVEKRDKYRFQVHQARTRAHNYESIDIPNLYLGGYLAQDIGLVVIAMHGTTYAIAGDILQREGRLP